MNWKKILFAELLNEDLKIFLLKLFFYLLFRAQKISIFHNSAKTRNRTKNIFIMLKRKKK